MLWVFISNNKMYVQESTRCWYISELLKLRNASFFEFLITIDEHRKFSTSKMLFRLNLHAQAFLLQFIILKFKLNKSIVLLLLTVFRKKKCFTIVYNCNNKLDSRFLPSSTLIQNVDFIQIHDLHKLRFSL